MLLAGFSNPYFPVSLENLGFQKLQAFGAQRLGFHDCFFRHGRFLIFYKFLKVSKVINSRRNIYLKIIMDVKEIKKEIYSTFAGIASSIGYSEIHGRIIGALIVNKGCLSLKELSKETGYSISTLSLSLDLLELLGMIKKVKKTADRQLYVEMQGNMLSGLKNAFLIRIQKSVDNTLEKFESYKDEVNKMKTGEKKKLSDSLNILEKEVNKLNGYLNLLSKIKI